MPRLLVVEDSSTQAEQLRLILTSEGFDVEVARNGRTGLERARAGAFDLILSDILMPDLSGYDLCRHIKIDPRTRTTPVVLLTQLNDPQDILYGLECGADNFITKPFDVNHLLRRIQDLLTNRARREAGQPDSGACVSFRGQALTITADKGQILDLLLSALEESVRARTREQEARAARDAVEKRAAEQSEASRLRDRHLTMLAHELRNPMAPLLNSLQVLRRQDARPEAREQSLERMERQLHHLNHLVDDLLDAARVVEGKMRLRLERLDLGRLVRTTAEDRLAALAGSGPTLEVNVPETPVWHQGDATRLVQVFDNLLDNAARHTPPEGHVCVHVATDQQRGQAVITVADTGAGLDAGILARLFQPFVQAEQSLDRPQGGLGLGLSVVKGLVELHGGQVAASSEGPGLGSLFTVRLPIEQEPPALLDAPAPAEVRAQGRRILIVEDNQDAADSLKMLLELLGYEAQIAYTGLEGVAAARSWLPHVVLCDIGLPDLDGYGVARQLRGDPGTAGIRLIALTGYGSAEARRQSQQAGFEHHLTKPANPQELLQLLTEAS